MTIALYWWFDTGHEGWEVYVHIYNLEGHLLLEAYGSAACHSGSAAPDSFCQDGTQQSKWACFLLSSLSLRPTPFPPLSPLSFPTQRVTHLLLLRKGNARRRRRCATAPLRTTAPPAAPTGLSAHGGSGLGLGEALPLFFPLQSTGKVNPSRSMQWWCIGYEIKFVGLGCEIGSRDWYLIWIDSKFLRKREGCPMVVPWLEWWTHSATAMPCSLSEFLKKTLIGLGSNTSNYN